jgi:hypothetical protein
MTKLKLVFHDTTKPDRFYYNKAFAAARIQCMVNPTYAIEKLFNYDGSGKTNCILVVVTEKGE